MRRTCGILFSLLISTATYGQSAQRSASPAGAPDACKDVEAYKDKAPEDHNDFLSVWFNTWQCHEWAEDHGNQQLLHDSFTALSGLFASEATALMDVLNSKMNAPAVCKVFQDYQSTSRDSIASSMANKLSRAGTLEKAGRAQEDFLARFKGSFEESDKARHDLFACSSWASDSHLAVIALETEQLAYELDEDAGSLPADIEKVAPGCKNAYSEADAILEFVDQHVGDNRVMPSDVHAYYYRASPVANCSAQLAKTKYRSAYEHLLLAVLAINNLMVIAEGNSEANLIRALPPPQPNSPIVIKVQSSYQQTRTPNHCTGTVFNLGSISNIDWNCN